MAARGLGTSCQHLGLHYNGLNENHFTNFAAELVRGYVWWDGTGFQCPRVRADSV
jgi:hypothetical protein